MTIDDLSTQESQPNVFELLSHQVSLEVPMLIDAKTSFRHWSLVESSLWKLPAAHEAHDKLALRLSYNDLNSLSTVQLTQLKAHLRKTVHEHNQASYLHVEARASIDPDCPHEIIGHEFDHIRVLPEQAKRISRADISFVWQDGRLFIVGRAYHDPKLTTDTEKAISATEPRVLSSADVEVALWYARKIGDDDFFRQIEGRISSRTIDEEIAEISQSP